MGRWSWGWESRLESASSWSITLEWAPRKWRVNSSSFPIVTRLWWHGILAISVTSLARYVCPFLPYLGGYIHKFRSNRIYRNMGMLILNNGLVVRRTQKDLSIVPCEGNEKKQEIKATWTLTKITGSGCNMSCELVFGGCMQGPFVNYQDTLMSITGGVGFFREARGVVRLHNISPFKFFYTFTLTGIPELPKHLTASVVPPSESAAAISEAVACDPLFTLPNFSN